MTDAGLSRIRRRLRPRHWLEFALAWLVYHAIRLLPLKAASDLGGWLGRRVGPKLRVTDRARRNLQRAFPAMCAAEIERIIPAMYDNLGRTFFEFPHLDRIRLYEEGCPIEVVGAENIDLLREDGRPGIFFSGHLGNWELCPKSAAERGLPIHLVYRAPNNPLMDDLYRRRMPGCGELVPKGAAGAKQALQLLKRGEHLGMLVDQKMNDGIPVRFFQQPAMTAPALAQFVLRFGCPVVPARCERLDGVKQRITLYPPLQIEPTGNRQADVEAIMARVNVILEQWIRERPEQWFWLHRRWSDD